MKASRKVRLLAKQAKETIGPVPRYHCLDTFDLTFQERFQFASLMEWDLMSASVQYWMKLSK